MAIKNDLSGIELLEGEEFRPIKGYPDYYVSNMGRVLSFRKSPAGRFRNSSENQSTGYYLVGLIRNRRGKRKAGQRATKNTSYNLHSLVAEAFLEKPKTWSGKRLEINHINSDKSDNRASNLEYLGSLDHGKDRSSKKQVGKFKLGKEKVALIKICLKYPTLFPVKRIAEVFRVSLKTIADIKRKRTWKSVEPTQREFDERIYFGL